jgi:hypothetical protein
VARRSLNGVSNEVRELGCRGPAVGKVVFVGVDSTPGNLTVQPLLVQSHRAFDPTNRLGEVWVLEQREVGFLLLAEVSVEQGMQAVEGRLERGHVVRVGVGERVDVLREQPVVERHDCRRLRVAESPCDLRVEPELLGLGVEP